MKVQYKIIRKARQRNTYLRFKTGQLIVSTNLGTSISSIEKFVNLHEKWIIKHQETYDARPKIIFNFEENSKILLFNKEYTIKFIKDNTCLGVNNIYVKTTKNSRKVVLDYCRVLLLSYYLERVAYWSKKMNLDYNCIKINNAKRQWAHCTKDKNLAFSLKTVVLDKKLIDYLIVHEMSHIVYFNHSKDFYNHIEKYLPDYKESQKELKRIYPIALSLVEEKNEVV